jgi:hypothetical protein
LAPTPEECCRVRGAIGLVRLREQLEPFGGLKQFIIDSFDEAVGLA